ncbi:MAG: hypothetical protein LUD01_10855 [Clostridiales bacterium]|nr:hypothetical protein [Clostridiales bacterium]
MKRKTFTIMMAVMMFALTACGSDSISDNETAESLSESRTGKNQEEANQETENQEEELPAEQTLWLCTTEEKYNSDNELLYTITNEYDEYGNLTLMIRSYSTKESEYRREYTYNNNHILESSTVSSSETSASGSIMYTEAEYTYDEYGNQATKHELTTFTEEDGTVRTEEYNYYYYQDAAGQDTGYYKQRIDADTFSLSNSMSSLPVLQEEADTDYEKVYAGDLLVKKTNKSGSTIYQYEYDENGNLTKETYTSNIGTDSESETVTLYTYEEQVCKTYVSPSYPESEELNVLYQAKTVDADGDSLYSYFYFYDENGNQIGAGNANSMAYTYDYYEYDDEGKIIRARARNSSGSFYIDMTYDKSGNRIREDSRKSEDGEIVVYVENEFDSDGNLLRSITHAVDDYYEDTDGAYLEYEYDENGILSACSSYNSDDTLNYYTVYSYDADGNVSTITAYDGDDNLTAVTTAYYTTIYVLAK